MIGNIQFLIEKDDDPEPRKDVVSQHIRVEGNTKYMFGWDQPLMSYYLQVHDLTLPEDDQMTAMFGTAKTQMYEVEDLVRVAKKHGLRIPYTTRVALYREKDDGQ